MNLSVARVSLNFLNKRGKTSVHRLHIQTKLVMSFCIGCKASIFDIKLGSSPEQRSSSTRNKGRKSHSIGSVRHKIHGGQMDPSYS